MEQKQNTGANMRFAIGEAGRYCLERYKVEGEAYYNQAAAFFAYRAGNADGRRVIFETRIDKAEVLGYTDSRHEAEVLADIDAKHPFPVSVIFPSTSDYRRYRK